MNTKIKRRLITLSALTLTSMSLFAQGIIIRKTDGTTQKVPYEQLQSIDTYDLEETPEDVESDERAVDLGLSVKWATMNVGANSPEEYGNYYAWGETETKEVYDWSTYKWKEGKYGPITKYCSINSGIDIVDNKSTLELEDDVAQVKWGDEWRMPTKAEQEELLTECTWTWTTQNSVNGYKITSKKNGKSIFLPATGLYDESRNSSVSSWGHYWSSSQYLNAAGSAYWISFNSSMMRYESNSRCCGCSIRPVCPNPSFVRVSSITLDRDNWETSIGESCQLSVTLSPLNATNNKITWSSSDNSIATVSENGWVTTMEAGTVIIIATASDGSGVKATCKVTVDGGDHGLNNGHEYVDLGLSVKWASMNIGANSSEGYGDYYAWGETEPYYTEGHSQDSPCTKWKTGKTGYNWDSYKWCNGSENTLTKYCTSSSYGKVDNKTILELEDDAAHVNWGGDWRMPTQKEIDELRNKCNWTWTTQNGVKGYKVTSLKNGNSLFLPAAGMRSYLYFYNSDGCHGEYWINSIKDEPCYAYSFLFDSSSYSWQGSYGRYCGFPVRAVCP